MKIAINKCYGGFGLSEEAIEMLLDKKGIEYEKQIDESLGFFGASYYEKGHAGDDNYYISTHEFWDEEKRNDQDLIDVIETLGQGVNTNFSDIKIGEIPDDVEWQIEEYDGLEHIAEKHRTWY